jgi:hypothetical protein
MPDLQTALTTAIKNQVLSTTINEWEEEEKQTMQAQPQAPIMQTQTQINGNTKTTFTGNMSKDLFTFIKDNPGCLTEDVRKAFADVEYKVTSINSLITQMIRNKMVSRNGVGNLESNRVYYKPISGITKKKNTAKPKAAPPAAKPQAAKPAPKPQAQGIAALAPEPTQDTAKGQEAIDKVLALPVREARAVYDALCLLRDLNVGEARHLYTELQKLFGG